MKKITYLLAFAMIFTLTSCGGGKTDKESKKEEAEAEETKADEKIADCDDFLKKYEEWTNEYIEVMEAVFGETEEEVEGLEERWNAMVQEAVSWSQQWATLTKCSMNEEYVKKFEEIADKAAKKLEEVMGGQE